MQNSKRFNRNFILLILPLVTLLMGVQQASCATPETILTIHGSNTIGARLIPHIAMRFLKSRNYTDIHLEPGEKENESYIIGTQNDTIHQIEIKAHGSSTSFKSFAENLCDIGMASRRIKEKEITKLSFMGDMTSLANEHILAIDGIAVIVNRENTVSELDVATIQQIFTGKIQNWKEIGGSDSSISVYSRDNNSGTYDTFKGMILKKLPLTESAKRYESNARLSEDVSRDINGIGFVGMPYVLNSKALKVKKRKNSIGVLPTTFTAAYEEYPLSRRLYLYTASNPGNPLTKEFVEFALSRNGQRSVAILGFAKLSMDMEERNINIERFTREVHTRMYREETLGGRRVNFNFRFDAEGKSLSNRSQVDLQRFIDYIQHVDQRYYEPLLIGINSCRQAERMVETVTKEVGADKFHVLPKLLCIDYAVDQQGIPLESFVEVWLRVVDDGA